MDDSLMVRAPITLPDVRETADQARTYQAHAKAANTWRAYRTDWADFTRWCADQGRSALPATPTTVGLYLTTLAQAGRKASTLQRRLSAISQFHQAKGLPSPTQALEVRTVWAGIRRIHGTAMHGMAPVVTQDLKVMVATLPDSLLGLRDRALLLLGFAGAFRRSELVSLNVDDMAFTRKGLVVTLRRSKTDQEGQGRKIGIPYGAHLDTCPVRTVQAWLETSGLTGGPVFRAVNRHGQLQAGRLSDKAVALVVKRVATAAGFDATQYAGHSLRAGLATAAAEAGASERAIMAQTGHRSVMMVRRYIREGSLFRDNAVAMLGL